jgi:hypothetical protein
MWDAEAGIAQVGVQCRHASLVSPGQMRTVPVRIVNLPFALKSRRIVPQPHELRPAPHDDSRESLLDITV